MDEKAPKIIKELIERFQRNLSEYKTKGYNEAQLRQEFINPFFEALGWDVYNKSGAAPAYRDVIHEDSIKITGGTKAPDYCFTLSGRRMFFVEAKKPAVGIVSDSNPAYQLRRYAWSAELSLSILTNFEDLCIYESRQKPHVGDKSSVERVKHIKYTEYVERWDEIASVFSYSSVKQGSFDQFAKSVQKKRGTQEVGDEFLKEIEEWREKLAKNIAIRDPNLGVRELNFCVQKTIDRIIFLRMCEDRGIESYGQLRSIAEKDHIYENLCKIFKKADEKYNSGLFHFRKEKQRNTLPDELTLSLSIDDAILKNIFRRLYYPNCPYEFSVLPPEILGYVYEQFLGKVIRLTEGHRAKIEEKPEVKKAGGVYYTPTYIVDYIVQNTVKKLCVGKPPKQISNIRILDPACGSGSFLLGAYSYLLQYHLDYYTQQKNTKRFKDEVYQNTDKQWFLTIKEKKRILLNNIYGVDIDSQAVEVTKLSLLLKVLEGTSKDIFEKQQKLWTERALPDLDNNIKCGNSLIGPDFYNGGLQASLFNDDEIYRINAFDWNNDFPEIMNAEGFDVVIGNPPYIRSQLIRSDIKDYFSENYPAAIYQPDTFSFFIQKGIQLLKNQGKLGYIVPNGILTNTYYKKLREYILIKTAPEIIVDLKDSVFSGVSVDTSIFVLKREFDLEGLKKNRVRIGEYPAKIDRTVVSPSNTIEQRLILDVPDCVFNTKLDNISIKINKKIFKKSKPLNEFFSVKAGMKVRKNFVSEKKLDQRYTHFLLGGDLKPYSVEWSGKYVCYDKKLENNYTNQAFRDENIFLTSPKLLIRQVMGKERIYSSIDFEKFYADQTIYILVPKDEIFDLHFVLGIISSRLMTFYFRRTLSDRKQTFPKIKGAQIKQLPIREINFNNLEEKFNYDKIIEKVKKLILLQKELKNSKLSDQKKILQRQINYMDQKLDSLIYELYNLTEKEIDIIEKSCNI